MNTPVAPLATTDITGNFTNIKTEVTDATFYGAALYNYNYEKTAPEITSITGTFSGNSSYSSTHDTRAGAIYNSWHSKIGEINGNFIGNSVTSLQGGKGYGGAIDTSGGTLTVRDGSFINNRVITSSSYRYGGAISLDTMATVNIIADKKDVIFQGNFTASKDNGDGTYEDRVSSGITVSTSSGAVLNLNAGEHSIIFNDRIDTDYHKPTSSSTININSTTSAANAPTGGTVVLNEDMSAYTGNVNLYNGTLQLGENGTFFNPNNFNVVNGTINTANGRIETTPLGNLTISDTLHLYFDADLKNGTVDKIFSNNTITEPGKITIEDINLLSEPGTSIQNIKLVDDSLKDAVVYNGKSILENKIFRYNVNYDPSTGNLNFNKLSGNSYQSYNPAVFAAPVAAQLGGYLTQLNTYDIAFTNVDMYMLMNRKDRTALKLRNKTASADNGIFSPLVTKYDEKAMWYKSFTTFENVPLKNGPKVSNVSYGMFAGGDSELKELGNGWEGMGSIYVGYTGSHQAYNGIGIYQNGGTLGLTGVAYKNNFYSALTANVGANQAEASLCTAAMTLQC